MATPEGTGEDRIEGFQWTNRRVALAVTAVGVVLWSVLGIVLPGTVFGYYFWGGVTFAVDVVRIGLQKNTVSSALRLSVPITFAAIGGIFAEKSGVINIGLEGLLIISAFTAVLVASVLGPTGGVVVIPAGIVGGEAVMLPNRWVGFAVGVFASTVLAALFAVVTIEFRADQIIAGLAVWLIALGLAPFASKVFFGSVNADNVSTLGNVDVPLLSDVPYLGAILFDANPTVFMMFFAVPLAWYVLNRTTFGSWIRASGENPKALDTAGVSVNRVRYAGVLLSGVFSGIGGAGLALGHVGTFIGSGQTMVNGKGFIAIVAYLFGNYNPVGAFGASMLFSGLQAIQTGLQNLAYYAIPESLIQAIPFVVVIVVLVFVGRTRIPESAGEHYESGEE